MSTHRLFLLDEGLGTAKDSTLASQWRGIMSSAHLTLVNDAEKLLQALQSEDEDAACHVVMRSQSAKRLCQSFMLNRRLGAVKACDAHVYGRFQALASAYGESAPKPVLVLKATAADRKLAAFAIHNCSSRANEVFFSLAPEELDREYLALAGGGTVFIEGIERLSTKQQDELMAAMDASPGVWLLTGSSRSRLELSDGGVLSGQLWARFAENLLEVPPASDALGTQADVVPFREAERHWQFLTLRQALVTTRGNKTKAARALQLSLTHFKRLCKQYPELSQLDF